jgi:hypothetical protein
MGAYSVREKQGLVPDLQLDDSHYELNQGHSRGEQLPRALIITLVRGARSTGFSSRQRYHR